MSCTDPAKIYEEALVKSRANDFPKTSIEHSALLTLIEGTRRTLQECSSEIGRAYLDKALKVQKSFLAPIRVLPTELLCSIFNLVVCTSSSDGSIVLFFDDVEGRFSCLGAIFHLTWICPRWRDIILSNPAFWCRFKIERTVGRRFSSSLKSMSSCMIELLHRSGTTAPVYLDIYISNTSPSGGGRPSKNQSDPCGLFPTLDALTHSASKWREVKLRFAYSECYLASMLEQLFSQNASFPNLENLCLVFPNSDLELRFLVLSHPPRLHTLKISSYRPTDPIDLRNLTTLKIGIYIGHSLATLLQKCPLLETLELCCSISHSGSEETSTVHPTPSSSICHSCLKRLKIEEVDDYDQFPIGFWRGVTLLRLTHLRNRNSISEPRFLELKKMLIDSQCSLQEVNLWLPRESVQSLVHDISISTESHTHLVFTQLHLDDDFIYCQEFVATPSSVEYCRYCWLGW